MLSIVPRLGGGTVKTTPGSVPSTGLMILKMNFNFNFKDKLRPPRQSIRTLTTECDQDHTVGFAG